MRTTLALALLVPVLMTGCADDARTEPRTEREQPVSTPDHTPEGATFAADVRIEGDRLLVSWRLDNDGEVELLVPDRVPLDPASSDWSTTRPYVVAAGDSGIEVSQRLFAVPEGGGTWATAPRVGVTRVPAGESLERELAIALPLSSRHPFGAPAAGTLSGAAGTVRFCLGVLAAPYPPALGLAEQPTGEGEVEVGRHGDAAYDAQHVFCSEPVALGS